MKRILVSILAVLLLFTPCTMTVEAANATYYLEDLDISVQIPEDYATVWRGIEENDPTLAMMGLSYAELMEVFEERGSYLVSASGIDKLTLVITLLPDDYGESIDFSTMEVDRLQGFADSVVALFEEQMVDVYEMEVYEQAFIKFVKVFYKHPENSSKMLDFCTVYKGKGIYFNFDVGSEGITDKQEEAIFEIINSVTLGSEENTSVIAEVETEVDTSEYNNEESDAKDSDEVLASETGVLSLDLPDMEEIQAEVEAEMEAQQVVTRRRQETSFVGEVIAGVIVAAIGGMIILIRKKRKEKEENQPIEDDDEWSVDKSWNAVDTQIEETPNVPTYRYCPSCGQPLSAGNIFCNNCGARVDN